MKKYVSFILLLALLCTGCSVRPSKDDDTSFDEKIVVEKSKQCVITDESSIASDFDMFDLGMTVQNDDLALSDLVIMFPVEDVCYLYFSMPSDQDSYAYRVKNIAINDSLYEIELRSIDGYYQKYKLEGYGQFKTENNLYQITEINYYNEKNPSDNHQYNISQNITTVFDEEKFFFEQEYLYNITLQGQCFESIYQFNKENNMLVDLWSKVIGNIERLDEDRRSFFYFAFKCYDIEKDIHFVPEDILQLDVEFERLTYEYQGKDSDIAENLEPETKKITQTIEPETRHIVGVDEKRSNKCEYVYDTINKLSEADLSKNVGKSNAAVLNQAAKQYDWAVQYGAEEGYPHKSNEAGLLVREYDINYTKVKDFKAIHIVYRYEGKKVSTGTNSLIKEVSTEIVEKVPGKPSKIQETKYDIRKIWQDETIGLLEKVLKSVGELLQPVIPILIIVVIVLIIRRFNRSRFSPLTKKYIEKVIKEKLDDE